MDPTCVICLSEVDPENDDEQKATTTSCGHMYHTDCIERWTRRWGTCPLCRTVIHKVDTVEFVDDGNNGPSTWIGFAMWRLLQAQFAEYNREEAELSTIHRVWQIMRRRTEAQEPRVYRTQETAPDTTDSFLIHGTEANRYMNDEAISSFRVRVTNIAELDFPWLAQIDPIGPGNESSVTAQVPLDPDCDLLLRFFADVANLC